MHMDIGIATIAPLDSSKYVFSVQTECRCVRIWLAEGRRWRGVWMFWGQKANPRRSPLPGTHFVMKTQSDIPQQDWQTLEGVCLLCWWRPVNEKVICSVSLFSSPFSIHPSFRDLVMQFDFRLPHGESIPKGFTVKCTNAEIITLENRSNCYN